MSATCLRLAAAWPNLGLWCSNRPMTFGCLGSLPGQNVSVFVNLRDGDRQPRRYTVSLSAGGRDSRSAFGGCSAGRVHPNGRMSTYLHDKAKWATFWTSAHLPEISC